MMEKAGHPVDAPRLGFVSLMVTAHNSSVLSSVRIQDMGLRNRLSISEPLA